VVLDLIGRPIGDVDAAAVCLPAGNSRSVALVGVGDTPVVLFFEFVLDRVRRGIAAEPELLDKLLPLVIGGETPPRLALLIRDNLRHILVDPLLIRCFQLFVQLGILEADSSRLKQTEREAGSSKHTYVGNPSHSAQFLRRRELPPGYKPPNEEFG
jgi:hypothetical protein